MPTQHRTYRRVVKVFLTICNKRLIVYRYIKYAFLLRKLSKRNIPTRFIAVRTNDTIKKNKRYRVSINNNVEVS